MIRYRFIENQVLQTLNAVIKNNNPELLSFPLDIIKIINLFPNYRIWSYQQYSDQANIPLNNIISYCNSESGCTFYESNNNRYLILFNEEQNDGRKRWTQAHELGHCKLKHCESTSSVHIANNNFNSITYNKLEHEADYFSFNLISPPPIYKFLNIKSSLDIQRIFGLSTQASLSRYDYYLKWKDNHVKTSFDSDIVKLFTPFINTYTTNNQ